MNRDMIAGVCNIIQGMLQMKGYSKAYIGGGKVKSGDDHKITMYIEHVSYADIVNCEADLLNAVNAVGSRVSSQGDKVQLTLWL